MSERTYTYFIAYLSETGYGNLRVEVPSLIRSMEHVRSIEQSINRDLPPGKSATVINWKLLRSVKKGSGNPPESGEKAVQESSPSKVE